MYIHTNRGALTEVSCLPTYCMALVIDVIKPPVGIVTAAVLIDDQRWIID